MFATLDWSADDDIPVPTTRPQRTANVLLNLAIRTSGISRNS